MCTDGREQRVQGMTVMASSEFTTFGTSHWVMLAIFVGVVWALMTWPWAARAGRTRRAASIAAC
jgi:hypothetical protein